MSDKVGEGVYVPLSSALQTAVAQFIPRLKHEENALVLSTGTTTVVRVGDDIVVKYGPAVAAVEKNTILLVSKHTSIPVPLVHGVYEAKDGITYIVMDFISGSSLYDAWHVLTDSEKESICKQLGTYFEQLHSVQGSQIGAVDGNPCKDLYFDDVEDRGPFNNELLMNEAIVSAPRQEWKPSSSYVNSILPWLPHNHDIVFSHGNLNQTHVIIDKERATVKAVVGWQQAGFFPEYWDFVNALTLVDWNSDWVLYVQKVLKPYYQEYALWYRIREIAAGM